MHTGRPAVLNIHRLYGTLQLQIVSSSIRCLIEKRACQRPIGNNVPIDPMHTPFLRAWHHRIDGDTLSNTLSNRRCPTHLLPPLFLHLLCCFQPSWCCCPTSSSMTCLALSPVTSDSLNNPFSPLRGSGPVTHWPSNPSLLHTRAERVCAGMPTWTWAVRGGVGGLFYVAVWEVRGIIDCYNWCPLISWQLCRHPRG